MLKSGGWCQGCYKHTFIRVSNEIFFNLSQLLTNTPFLPADASSLFSKPVGPEITSQKGKLSE